jgi:hypothetical protein
LFHELLGFTAIKKLKQEYDKPHIYILAHKDHGNVTFQAIGNKSEHFSAHERRRLVEEMNRQLRMHPQSSLYESLFVCQAGRKTISVGFALNHSGLVVVPYYNSPECKIYNLLGKKKVSKVQLLEQGKFLSIVQTDAETVGLVPSYVREAGGLRSGYQSQQFFCLDLRGQFATCQLIASDLVGVPVKVDREFYHVEGGGLLFVGDATMRTVPGPVITDRGEIVGFTFAEAVVQNREYNEQKRELVENKKCLYVWPWNSVRQCVDMVLFRKRIELKGLPDGWIAGLVKEYLFASGMLLDMSIESRAENL